MNIFFQTFLIFNLIFFSFLNWFYSPLQIFTKQFIMNYFNNMFLEINFWSGETFLIYNTIIFLSSIIINLGFIHWLKILLFVIFSLVYFTKADLDNFSLRWFALFFSIILFLFSMFILFNFDPFQFNFQFTYVIESKINLFNFSWFFEIDGISLFFILLTTFITPICLLVSWEIVAYLRFFIICFFLIEFFLLVAFTTTNLLIFFIAFESILIPMFLIIGIWGTRFERVKAAYLFFLYTLVGSIFFLLNFLR